MADLQIDGLMQALNNSIKNRQWREQQDMENSFKNLQMKAMVDSLVQKEMERTQSMELANRIPGLVQQSTSERMTGPYNPEFKNPIESQFNPQQFLQQLPIVQAQYPYAKHDQANAIAKALEARAQDKYHYFNNAQGQPMRVLDTRGAIPEMLDQAVKQEIAKTPPADWSGYLSYINNGSFQDNGQLNSPYATNAREALSAYGINPKDVTLKGITQPGAKGKTPSTGQYNLAGDFKADDKGITVNAGGGLTGKPMPNAIQTSLSDLGKDADSVEYLKTSFQPQYGGMKSKTLADGVIEAQKRFGADSPAAAFWMTYQERINAYRKGLFGSALTPQEKSEFEKAIVNPSMEPKLIASYLNRQDSLVKKSLARQATTNATYYGQDAVQSLIGRPLSSLPSAMGSGYDVPPPAKPAKASASSSGERRVTSDGRILEKVNGVVKVVGRVK